jgi:hypothetical protein
MVKVFLGNCLINDAINRVLVSESQNIKKITVFTLIVFSLFIFGVITILKHMNPLNWMSVSHKDVKKVRAAH